MAAQPCRSCHSFMINNDLHWLPLLWQGSHSLHCKIFYTATLSFEKFNNFFSLFRKINLCCKVNLCFEDLILIREAVAQKLSFSVVSWFQCILTVTLLTICPFSMLVIFCGLPVRASCVLLSDETIWISSVGGVFTLLANEKNATIFLIFHLLSQSYSDKYFLMHMRMYLCDQ